MRQNTLLNIIAVLAFTMNLMAQITPLWLTPSNGFAIQICSGTDVRTITIDEQGNEIPAPAPPSTKQHCAFCLASGSHNHFILPQTITTLTTFNTYKTQPFANNVAAVKSAFRKSSLPRGPPLLS